MNSYLYNQGTELNTSTGYYETPHRLYDAALGRFMGVDAMAAIYPHQSPYHYANNNPVMYNDPTGLYGNNSDWGISFNGANYGHPSADWYNMGYGSFYDYAVDYQAYYQWMSQSYYGHQVSNNPDAYNIMRNALMGVPNAIATGISSEVPVDAWRDYTLEPYGTEVYVKGKLVRRTVEGYSRVYSKKRNNGGRFSSSGSGSNYYLFDESDESMVYGWMLRLQDYHKKEIAAYLVRKGNGKKGILLLPWQNNTSSSSWIDYPNTLSGTISDNYGNTYETLAVVHTHPIFNGESPLEAVRPSDDDVRIIGHLGIPVILSQINFIYRLIQI